MLEIRHKNNDNDVLVLEDKRSRTFALNEYADAGVQIPRVAYEHWGKGTVRPHTCYPHWSIYLIHDGRLHCENAGGKVGKHSVLFFPPDSPRGITCHDGSVELGLILMSGTEVEALAESTIGAGFQHIVPADFPMVWRHFEMMLSDALSGRHDAHALCSLWARIILQTLSTVPSVRSARGRTSTLPARAKQLMDDHWVRLANARVVARELRVHPSYLYREFKKAYRCAPGQYMLRLKIQRAADDLLRSHATVTQIADAYGFSDPFTFSRAFKRVMGEAPSRFAARFR